MIRDWIHRFLHSLVLRERSSAVLTASFAVGAYVAFSPYIALHTVECIVFSWLFSLNFAVTLIVSNVINNPWSMVPVYASGHWLGDCMLRWCDIDPVASNPWWMCYVNEPLQRVTGIQGVSFWGFMIGANILGIVAGIISYITLKPIFNALANKIHGHSCEQSSLTKKQKHDVSTGEKS